MRFTWRTTDPVRTYDDWSSRIAAKDNRPGRSAPSLARSWAGVIAVAGALGSHEDLAGFAFTSGAIEAQTAFDAFPGGKRNHDLLLVGTASTGATVVSIEAKADETFGQTLRAALKAGQVKRAASEATNTPERVEGLVAALIEHRHLMDERVLDLRYQLLTGMAGAVAAATALKAVNAVFLVHEFITDATTDEAHRRNTDDLYELGTTVVDVEVPVDAHGPWCIGPLRIPGDDGALRSGTQLYIAKAVTDLRGT
jgi:hypothetical protein